MADSLPDGSVAVRSRFPSVATATAHDGLAAHEAQVNR